MTRLYRVLRYRIVLAGICALAVVAVATAPARAATPRPVRASSVKVVAKAKAVHLSQPAPLTIAQLEAMLTAVVGTPILISCDATGVPSPIDGHTLDTADDGETFWTPDADGVWMIGNVAHISTGECWAAEQANRHRDPDPVAYFTFRGQRTDNVSGAVFNVLLHESFHIALRSTDEGVVECAAQENAWPLVEQLHLPAWEASMMLAGMAARHYADKPGSPYRAVC